MFVWSLERSGSQKVPVVAKAQNPTQSVGRLGILVAKGQYLQYVQCALRALCVGNSEATPPLSIPQSWNQHGYFLISCPDRGVVSRSAARFPWTHGQAEPRNDPWSGSFVAPCRCPGTHDLSERKVITSSAVWYNWCSFLWWSIGPISKPSSRQINRHRELLRNSTNIPSHLAGHRSRVSPG